MAGFTEGQKILKSRVKKTCEINKSVSRNKKIREIAFLAVLHFFPVQKLIFGLFLKLQKMEFGQINFHEIDIYFISRLFLA